MTNEIKKLVFKGFLIENGIYETFEKKLGLYLDSFIERNIQQGTFAKIMKRAFGWDDSKEGREFWFRMNVKWEIIVEDMEA